MSKPTEKFDADFLASTLVRSRVSRINLTAIQRNEVSGRETLVQLAEIECLKKRIDLFIENINFFSDQISSLAKLLNPREFDDAAQLLGLSLHGQTSLLDLLNTTRSNLSNIFVISDDEIENLKRIAHTKICRCLINELRSGKVKGQAAHRSLNQIMEAIRFHGVLDSDFDSSVYELTTLFKTHNKKP